MCYLIYRDMDFNLQKWYEYLDNVEDEKFQKMQDEKFY